MLTDPTYLALLEAIRQDPQDDTVRLIAADRLEELGECDRADLIRVQIKLTRTPKYNRPVLRLYDACIEPAKTEPVILDDMALWQNIPVDYIWIAPPILKGRLPLSSMPEGIVPGTSVLIELMDNGPVGNHQQFLCGRIRTAEIVYPSTSVLVSVFLESMNAKETVAAERRRWLETRERFLLSRIGFLLTDGLVPGTCDRGFITELHCKCQRFLDHATMIYQQCPALKKVVLTDKRPLGQEDGGFSWWRKEAMIGSRNLEHTEIPSVLFINLSIEAIASHAACFYPSERAALNDLSRACIRYLEKPVLTP